jgi:uncharacterized membrane protein YeaQ/YmgE (transglycosylase-associated protein family)
MSLIAQWTLHPGGLFAWIGIGLIAGWLAGLVTSGGGYGIVADIVLGLVGALAGGMFAGFYIDGETGFWSSLLIACIGACMVIALAHILVPDRATRH